MKSRQNQHIRNAGEEAGVYDLSNMHFDNPMALLKYLSHQNNMKIVNLSNCDIKKEALASLSYEMS